MSYDEQNSYATVIFRIEELKNSLFWINQNCFRTFVLYFGKSAILSRTCFVIFGNENNIFHSDGFGIGYNLWYAEKKGFFK